MNPLSPDGLRYVAMARGASVPYPFQGRPLVPAICGTSEARWIWSGRIAALILVATTSAWAWQVTDSVPRAIAAGALVASLRAAVHLQLIYHPVLVDLPAMAMAALGAYLWTWHPSPVVGALVVVLSCLAGITKESAPVFMALYAWHPALAVGVVGHLWCRLRRPEGPEVEGVPELGRLAITDPLDASRQAHAGMWGSALIWLAPWGPCLLGLWGADVALVATLAVAYAQTIVATDTERLYQWAALPMAVAAVSVVPDAAAVPMIVAAVWWPWKGRGF